MSIGTRIRQRRDELGITQPVLAKLVGVSKGSIGNYESGVSNPNEPILIKLFEVLQCDANYLYQDYININNDTSNFEINVTQHERNIINAYRGSSKDTKIAVCKILDVEIEATQTTIIYRAASSDDNHPAEIVETDIDYSKLPPTDIKL